MQKVLWIFLLYGIMTFIGHIITLFHKGVLLMCKTLQQWVEPIHTDRDADGGIKQQFWHH